MRRFLCISIPVCLTLSAGSYVFSACSTWNITITGVGCQNNGGNPTTWTITVQGKEQHGVGVRKAQIDAIFLHPVTLPEDCIMHDYSWSGDVATSGNHTVKSILYDDTSSLAAQASSSIT